MRKLIVSTFVSLDGIMQAPGGPEEDPTGGFALGGWTFRYWDENSGDSVLNYFTPSGIESPLFYSLHVSLTHFKLSVQCLVKSKGAAMRMTGMIVMVFGFGLMVLGYQFSLSAESQITHAVTGYLSI